jgi:hypothetical protein
MQAHSRRLHKRRRPKPLHQIHRIFRADNRQQRMIRLHTVNKESPEDQQQLTAQWVVAVNLVNPIRQLTQVIITIKTLSITRLCSPKRITPHCSTSRSMPAKTGMLMAGTALNIGVIALWTLLFGVSVFLGLQRGLRRELQEVMTDQVGVPVSSSGAMTRLSSRSP